jgi:predicted metal-dependent peptidase
MAVIKGYQNGYDAAVEAIKAALAGGGSQSGAGGGSSKSSPLPPLPFGDNQGQSQPGQGQSNKNNKDDKKGGGDKPQLTDVGPKKELDNNTKDECDASDVGTKGGGFISQEAGSKIAEAEGYSKRVCEKKSESQIRNEWKDATERACTKAGNTMGQFVRKIDKLYKIKKDWKGELRLYIGKALSKFATDSRWGERKALAVFGELKKYERQGDRDLDSVIYCIDTSGSVSSALLERMVSECVAISKKKGIDKATYVPFDYKVQSEYIQVVKGKSKLPSMNMGGGGGTSFENLFSYLDEHYGKKVGKKCPLVMVFTDGMCNPIPKRSRWMQNLIWVAYDNKSFGDDIKGLDNKSYSDKNTKFIYLDTKDIR